MISMPLNVLIEDKLSIVKQEHLLKILIIFLTLCVLKNC